MLYIFSAEHKSAQSFSVANNFAISHQLQTQNCVKQL